MKFSEFLSKIEQYQSSELGGLEAQFKMAPKLRLKYSKDKIAAQNPRRAAVLALFYPNQYHETCLLLTKRANYKGTHGAQISFPGGKVDEKDSSLQETALRETQEEVGILPSSIVMIKEMTDVYIPPSNFLATPFIAFTEQIPKFRLNHEVEHVIEIKLTDLLDDAHITTVNLTTSYMKNIDVPCFKIDNHIIWGATGMMLSEIRALIQ